MTGVDLVTKRRNAPTETIWVPQDAQRAVGVLGTTK